MSLDKSLKTSASLSRHRNVLKRDERIEVLQDQGKWDGDRAPIGLPKVAHRKVAVGGKKKDVKKKDEAAEGEKKAE